MAIIEKYMMVAASYPVASGVTIIQGQLVGLDANGNAVPAVPTGGSVGVTSSFIVGIAGDTKSTGSGPYSAVQSAEPSLNVSSEGPFVNRISDMYDETKASGMVTVYQGKGGMFATNQYDTAAVTAYTVGVPLYATATTGVESPVTTGATNGLFTTLAVGPIVAYCTAVPAAEESGVPGTDVNGSMSLGNYLEVVMAI